MLNEDEIFSRLDIAFARFLSQRSMLDIAGKQALETLLATLSQKQHQGHSCIEINELDKNLLLNSGLVSESPTESSQTYPLIIEQNRLYLQRYWFYEDRLAKQIKQLSQISITAQNLDNLLDRYFAPQGTVTDWQREAAKIAGQKTFCIITGGPGTGKTTTVCKILALLQELSEQPLLIALAAPTGKAAARLQEAVALNRTNINCPAHIKEQLPLTAITLHRLLGARPPSPYFHHDANNRLVYDVIVVDEASMVDLALMSKLVDALKPEARLILLGDKDQLTSVESGAVLADLIPALPNNTVELRQSFRFDDGIKKLATAVNNQDIKLAEQILVTENKTVGLLERQQLIPYLLGKRQRYVKLIENSADFSDIYQEFSSFQVLCSNRHGKNGTVEINQIVEREIFRDRLNYNSAFWYPGRPVIVMQNHPNMHLYNGDIGICLADREQNGNLLVFFQRPDGTVKKYIPARMPPCETVFAMTIHKSQGSEFDEALIVLPDTMNPVLSKELLYTAITRAKKRIKLVAEKSMFIATISLKAKRVTGLADKLSNIKSPESHGI